MSTDFGKSRTMNPLFWSCRFSKNFIAVILELMEEVPG